MSREHPAWDVVVTGASTRVAYNLLRSLARRGLRVGLGSDIHSGMAAFSRYCAGTFRHPCPNGDPLGFMTTVRDVLMTHRAAVYMPADEDVFVVAEHAHLLRDVAVRTVLAPADTLRRLDDKHRSIVLARSLGLPTPETMRPTDLDDAVAFAGTRTSPVVVKLIRSSGGQGVWVIPPGEIATVLPRILKQNDRRYGDFIVQEFIRGTGYGVSALCDHGTVKASFVHRRLRERSPSGGPSTLRESVRQPLLERYAERLLQHVGHHGVAMVEFKHDEATGKTWFLEVNPRWWGSVALAIRAGVDFPALFYELARGQTWERRPEYKPGVTVRWLLGDLLALKNQLLSSGSRPPLGQLWGRAAGYDDAYADDLLPLAAELALYVRKTLRSRWATASDRLLPWPAGRRPSLLPRESVIARDVLHEKPTGATLDELNAESI